MKKRADNRYCKKVVLPNGSPKYFYSSKKTERAATRDINEQMLKFNEEIKNLYKFQVIADEWNTEYQKEISYINYRKNTKAQYERILDYFFDTNICELDVVDICNFIQFLISKKYSKKTITNHKSILNMIFNHAISKKYITVNPVREIRLPKKLPKTERNLPTTEELLTVSSHYEGFDLLPYFLLYTGCRRSEALAIKLTDIDFKHNKIKIRNHVIHDGNKPVYEPVLKTDAAYRNVILLDRLKEVIPKNFEGFLFSMNGDGNEPLTKSAYAKRWAAYCKRYNLHITAQQLRYGYATMLYEAEIGDKDAQDLMGHRNITLTRQVYTRIRTDRDEKGQKSID